MTTRELLAIATQRGLTIRLKDGQPVISSNGHKEEVTAKLLAVLKNHRARIITLLLAEELKKNNLPVSRLVTPEATVEGSAS